MRRVIVTGSRFWSDTKTLYGALTEEWKEHGDFILIHGNCPTGADRLANEWAMWSVMSPNFNIHIEKFSADWSQGKKAGPVRNQKMVDTGADICLAFPTDSSRGTLDCIRCARVANIPVRVFHENPDNVNFMAEGGSNGNK